MGSATLDVDLKPDECFERIQRIIGDFDFEVKGAVPNQIVNAEGGRDFSWGWLILLILIFWPLAIIYYLTRKKNSIAVSIRGKNGGSRLVITSSGRKGERLMNAIMEELKMS